MTDEEPFEQTTPSSGPRGSGVAEGATLAGRYRLVRFIAAGGMGEVWEAEDLRLEERVALKTVRPDLLDDESLRRLESEVKLARRVSHHHVCRMFELGEHVAGEVEPKKRVSFITMELLRGQALSDVLRTRGRLPAPEALVILEQLAAALDAAHAAGVVHRDFKSPNVFVEDERGQVRAVVTDFGIARTLDAQSRITANPRGMMGTPAYMAPEQVDGRDAGPAADLFALGVVAFELVTGRLPFIGDNALAMAMARLHHPPLRAKDLEASVPGAWDPVLARAMAKNPSDRFPSGAAFVSALRSPPEPQAPRRLRSLAPAAGGLAVVLLAALGALVVRQAERPPEPAPSRPLATAPGALDAGARAELEELAAGTESPQARGAFLAGFQAWRDGDVVGSVDNFKKATQLDPSYGAAHLWAALPQSLGDLLVARPFFLQALRHRASMGAVNQLLLDAEVPCIQAQPPDSHACARRLEAAVAVRPASPWLRYWLAVTRYTADGPSDAMVADMESVRAFDPNLVVPLPWEGQALAYLGRFDDALAVLERCLELQPGASECLSNRVYVHLQRRDCAALRADALRWQAVQAADYQPWYWLAMSSAAHEVPRETVQELLTQTAARLPPTEALMGEELLALEAVLHGEFGPMRSWAEKAEPVIAARADQSSHYGLRGIQIALARESGQLAEAARLAEDTLRRKDSWQADPRNDDWAMAKDFEPFFADVLVEAGTLSRADRELRRGVWAETWRSKTLAFMGRWPWLIGYASIVRDVDGAREALSTMPDGGVPPFYSQVHADEGVGQMFLLTGHPAEALPYLWRAAHGCVPLEEAFGTIRARVPLGDALAQTGDRAGACAEYRSVIERWGKVKPRSVTAEAARKRFDALHCPAK